MATVCDVCGKPCGLCLEWPDGFQVVDSSEPETDSVLKYCSSNSEASVTIPVPDVCGPACAKKLVGRILRDEAKRLLPPRVPREKKAGSEKKEKKKKTASS